MPCHEFFDGVGLGHGHQDVDLKILYQPVREFVCLGRYRDDRISNAAPEKAAELSRPLDVIHFAWSDQKPDANWPVACG